MTPHRCKHNCNSHKATTQTQNCNRASTFATEKNYSFKSPLLKILKQATHRRHKQTKTQLDNDSETHGRQRLHNLDRKKASL